MSAPISVIMSVYNVTGYVPKAIESVLAQTVRGAEILIVNDGCPDTERLEAALKPYRQHIRYQKQENRGVGAARHEAVLAAHSPWLAQLDPDDWWEPHYLETQMRLLEANPDIDLLYGNGVYFGAAAMEGKLLMDYMPSEGEVTLASLLDGRVNIVYSALIRREAVLQAGNFDEELRTSEDFDLWLRMLRTGARMAYHREPLLHYRLRDDSLTAGSAEASRWLLQVLHKTEARMQLSETEQRSLEKRRLATQMNLELLEAKAAIAEGEWKTALWHMELYRRHRPSRKLSGVIFLLRFFPWLLRGGVALRDALLRTGMWKARKQEQV